MEKEYIAGEPQRYEIGGRVFIVEPRYRKDGESMADMHDFSREEIDQGLRYICTLFGYDFLVSN